MRCRSDGPLASSGTRGRHGRLTVPAKVRTSAPSGSLGPHSTASTRLKAVCKTGHDQDLMRRSVASAMFVTVAFMAQEKPPQILQIVREPIIAGNEAAYEMIEDETALACAELECPHPHLALETLFGPREIWWLNFFGSEAERLQVTDDYARNAPLMEVLTRNSERKSRLTGEVASLLLTHRPDLSADAGSELWGSRFIVVTVVRGTLEREGSVFEASDGSYYILQPVRTRGEAERLAAASLPGTTVLAVRPSWGMPAKEWIDADRDFWISNPTVYRQERDNDG